VGQGPLFFPGGSFEGKQGRFREIQNRFPRVGSGIGNRGCVGRGQEKGEGVRRDFGQLAHRAWHSHVPSLCRRLVSYNAAMSDRASTLKEAVTPRSDEALGTERHPGVALLFSGGLPQVFALSLEGGPLELGRGSHGMNPDQRMSRRHARISYDGRRFWVTDLGSHNGTAADGRPVVPDTPTEVQRVVRMGDSLFGVFQDIEPLCTRGVSIQHGKVLGPLLQEVFSLAAQSATYGDTLHVTGESGAGKEMVAQHFHQSSPQKSGPFVAVNCAAIPQGVAERLLFGTRRGAYSGAVENAEGYLDAASGGTLFLDEVGDLDVQVQAKLLRVIETRELLPLGANRPHRIDLHVCSATNKDLKQLVALGRFREDLYYRIARPCVHIPPLRKRIEEIPWLVEAAVKRTSSSASIHASLVELCMLRPWPGNIRELLVEVRSAAQNAAIKASSRIESKHLPEGAGSLLRALSAVPEVLPEDSTPPSGRVVDPAEGQKIEQALRAHHGNVAGTARALGLHRTQLRRLIERYGLDPQDFGPAGNGAEKANFEK